MLDHGGTEAIGKVLQRPTVAGWIEAGHTVAVNHELVAEIISIDGGVQDTDISTNTGEF